MPVFIGDVQGLQVSFKIAQGVNDIASCLLPGSVENLLPRFTGEHKNSGRVVTPIGIGDNYLLRSVPRCHCSKPIHGLLLILEEQQKGGAILY